MKLATLTKLSCAFSAALACVAIANADPITGNIGFDGTATVNGGANVQLSAVTTISSITATVDDGTQGGSYSSVPGGTLSPVVTFGTPITGIPSTPSLSGPLWSFTSGAWTYSFDVSTISVTLQNANFLDLQGSGIAYITGAGSPYTATVGDWTLDLTSANGNRAVSFSFGANTAIPAVPDSGMTALLIGLGMGGIGLGMIARRRSLTRS